MPKEPKVTTFFGEVYDTEDDDLVEMLCLINENPQVLEVRRFSADLFENPKINDHFKLTITETVGRMVFEIEKVDEDISEKFKKKDSPFDDLKMSAFFSPED